MSCFSYQFKVGWQKTAYSTFQRPVSSTCKCDVCIVMKKPGKDKLCSTVVILQKGKVIKELGCVHFSLFITLFETSHKKANNLGFRPGLTQTSLYSHRSRLEA